MQSIVERFPGSTLGQTLRTVPRRDGTTDATIDPEHFHAQFAADVPATEAARMAVTQRPITLEALAGATGPDPLCDPVPHREGTHHVHHPGIRARRARTGLAGIR